MNRKLLKRRFEQLRFLYNHTIKIFDKEDQFRYKDNISNLLDELYDAGMAYYEFELEAVDQDIHDSEVKNEADIDCILNLVGVRNRIQERKAELQKIYDERPR